MEPAMARVLALSLMAPKLTESLGKISFCTSACTSSLQERRGFLRNALGATTYPCSSWQNKKKKGRNPSLLLTGKQETHPCSSWESKNPRELAQLSVTGV